MRLRRRPARASGEDVRPPDAEARRRRAADRLRNLPEVLRANAARASRPPGADLPSPAELAARRARRREAVRRALSASAGSRPRHAPRFLAPPRPPLAWRIHRIVGRVTSAALHGALLFLLLYVPARSEQAGPGRPRLTSPVRPVQAEIAKDAPRRADPDGGGGGDDAPVDPVPDRPAGTGVFEPSVDVAVEVAAAPALDIPPVEPAAILPDDPPVGAPPVASAEKFDSGVLGVGPGRNVEGGRGGPGRIGEGLKRLVGRRVAASEGVLLVWVLDISGSMRDDREALALETHNLQALLTEEGKHRMESAVVQYIDTAKTLLAPTPDADAVREAIVGAPTAGGVENACAAVLHACEEVIGPDHDGWTKVVALLTDESANDQDALEDAAEALRAARARLFVIGPESPFQIEENGTGPETARIELPVADTGLALPSGFGVYDLAYLAGRSGGAYYILASSRVDETVSASVAGRIDRRRARRERAAGLSREERAALRERAAWRKERTRVRPSALAPYRPSLVAREHYPAYVRREAERRILRRLKDERDARGQSVKRWSACSGLGQYREARAALGRRMAMLHEEASRLVYVRPPDARLTAHYDRRMAANLDLYYLLVRADQLVTDAHRRAFEAYDPADLDRYRVDGTLPTGLLLRLEPVPEADRGKATRAARAAALAELREEADRVIRRHPHTPFALAADRLHRWAVDGSRPRRLVARLPGER